jgi:hypothetical protein
MTPKTTKSLELLQYALMGHCEMCDTKEADKIDAAWAHINRIVTTNDILIEALALSEGFISGFEDDESQENIEWLLTTIRRALKRSEKL